MLKPLGRLFAPFRSMVERRKAERRGRLLPSEHADVTRLEHENLCGQMDEVLRMLRRIESEIHALTDRVIDLEKDRRPSRVG